MPFRDDDEEDASSHHIRRPQSATKKETTTDEDDELDETVPLTNMTPATGSIALSGGSGNGGDKVYLDLVETEPCEHVSDVIGSFGRWQLLVCLFHMSMQFFSAYHSLGKTFYAPKQDFWCADYDLHAAKNATLSRTEANTTDKCSIPCKRWAYDTSTFDLSIINEWDLVCSSSWIPSMTQSVYMGGVMVSSLFASQISDRWGRRMTVRAGLIMELAAGLLVALAPNVMLFTVGRFFIALGSYTRGLSGSVLIVESVGLKKRAFWSQAINFGWVVGYVTLPGLAYLTKNFRTLQLVVTGSQMAVLPFLLWVPESPRWLLSQGKYSEAAILIRSAAAMNGIASGPKLDHQIHSLQQHFKKELNANSDSGVKQGIMELFSPRVRHLRRTLFIMYFTWFVNGFVYYGISLNMDQFAAGSSLFWSFAFMGLIELPSYSFNAIGLQYIGRRTFVSSLLFVAGISLFITIFLQSEDLYVWRISVALVGKFCIASSYAAVYLVAMEVFPTVLRQTAIGTCSASSRVGGILAPFVKEIVEYTHLGVALGLFSALALVDVVAILAIPEMKDEELPDTLSQAEEIEVKQDHS